MLRIVEDFITRVLGSCRKNLIVIFLLNRKIMKLTVVILGIIWYSYIIIKCNQCWKAFISRWIGIWGNTISLLKMVSELFGLTKNNYCNVLFLPSVLRWHYNFVSLKSYICIRFMPKRSNIDFGAVCPFIYKFYLISNF